jgi:hypothetical protein
VLRQADQGSPGDTYSSTERAWQNDPTEMHIGFRSSVV